jgi:hypothetical protein
LNLPGSAGSYYSFAFNEIKTNLLITHLDSLDTASFDANAFSGLSPLSSETKGKVVNDGLLSNTAVYEFLITKGLVDSQ